MKQLPGAPQTQKQPRPSDFRVFARPQLPPALVTSPVPPRSSKNGNGARGTPSIHRERPSEYEFSDSVISDSVISDYVISDSSITAVSSISNNSDVEPSSKASRTIESMPLEDENLPNEKVLERLKEANDFANDLASTLASCDAMAAHPTVLPRSMHTMQFEGPNRGIGHIAQQALLDNGLMRDATGAVVQHSLSAGSQSAARGQEVSHSDLLLRWQHRSNSTRNETVAGHPTSHGDGDAMHADSDGAPVATTPVATSDGSSVSNIQTAADSTSASLPQSSMHVPRRGGWHVRRSQLFKELGLGAERKGVLVADGWLLPGFSRVPNVPKEMWPKLLYALDIVCRKLYSEIEVRFCPLVTSIFQLHTRLCIAAVDTSYTYVWILRHACSAVPYSECSPHDSYSLQHGNYSISID